ncbi:MAG TPA: hypothetical protein VIQ03_12520 [Gammaproteobacteria bacterium]
MPLYRTIQILIITASLLISSISAIADTQQVQVETPPPILSVNEIELFEKIDELAQNGVTGLALRMIEKNQPSMNEQNVSAWLLWEKKRISLMQQLELWNDINRRIDNNADLFKDNEIDSADRHWFYTQQIRACLQNGENNLALEKLRPLLWNTEEPASPEIFAQWRRQVIRAYLNMDDVQDAQRAMRRFMQDYGEISGDDDLQWKITQAQLFLRGGRTTEAVRVLEKLEAKQTRPLLLVAKMQARLLSAEEVEKDVRQLLKKNKLEASLQRLYWYVLLTVANDRQDNLSQVSALENLLQLKGIAYIAEFFPDARDYVNADALWKAYESLGLQIANENKLLRGDDEAWYVMASNSFEKDAVRARALFAVLALNAHQQIHKQLSMQQMVLLLDKETDGLEIIQQLFVHSSYIADITQVPFDVRYRLVDYALSRADLKSAAHLMEQLQQPPKGEDLFSWSLRRARVLILGGQYAEGAEVLKTLLGQSEMLQQQQIDQYMQVVFDMQNVQQHDMALELFEQLERFPLTGKLNREITFWKAESWQQKGEYEKAAVLFLKSAHPIDGTYDPWYHTASFRAAESLAQADLIDDARQQYIKLLRLTDNSARKAVIRQRLQQLYLKQSKNLSEATAK